MNLLQKVEAVLYACETPLSAGDIASLLGEEREIVVKAIKSLAREYGKRETCLYVARTGIRYKLQLRNEFTDLVAPVSKREIDPIQLKILGFVAANPGCIRGDIVQRFGEKSRTLIQDLVKRKLLSEKKYRNTDIYDVTREFYRYFNIKKSDLEMKAREMDGGLPVQ